MKVEQVKETAEELAVKIFEYIDAAALADEERDHLYLEIATSFLTCAVHKSDHLEASKDIIEKSKDIMKMVIVGYNRFLDGNTERIKRDLSK